MAVAIVVAIGFFLVRARVLRRFRTTIVTLLVVGTAPVFLCVLRVWRYASGEPHRVAASPVAFGIAALLVLLILGGAGRLWQQRWHRADLRRASLGAALVVLLVGVGI